LDKNQFEVLKTEDDRLWESTLQQHGSRMLLFARQFVRNREDAEDVVQEAFSKMWRSGAIAEGGDRMIGKFYGCIRWAALDWLRKNKRRSRREDFAAQSDVLEKGGGYFERALETEELAETGPT